MIVILFMNYEISNFMIVLDGILHNFSTNTLLQNLINYEIIILKNYYINNLYLKKNYFIRIGIA